jgi:hypothetical protein
VAACPPLFLCFAQKNKNIGFLADTYMASNEPAAWRSGGVSIVASLSGGLFLIS